VRICVVLLAICVIWSLCWIKHEKDAIIYRSLHNVIQHVLERDTFPPALDVLPDEINHDEKLQQMHDDHHRAGIRSDGTFEMIAVQIAARGSPEDEGEDAHDDLCHEKIRRERLHLLLAPEEHELRQTGHCF